jgi:hypothetical protein
MEALLSKGGHSAQVKIQLVVGNRVVPVAQMGPDFLLVPEPFDLPPGDATLRLRIDESERSWEVRMPDGISAGSEEVRICLPE